MIITDVKLISDTQLKSNVKYRNGLPRGTQIWPEIQEPQTIAQPVSIGNLSSKDIYSDNTIELSCPFELAGRANYIIINFSNVIILVGEITNITYTNDNNTRVDYVVDQYSSAIATNTVRNDFLTNAMGFCERANIGYTDANSLVNLQPEPFSGNDVKRGNPVMTDELNDAINQICGTNQTNNHLFGNGYVLVLWVSMFVAVTAAVQNKGISRWIEDPEPLTPDTIVTVSSMMPQGNELATTPWMGGYSKGLPLVFTSDLKLNEYLNALLTNCGMRKIIPPDGLTSDGTIRRQVTVDNNSFISDTITQYQADSMNNVDMEQVRVVTSDDIYNIQIIPENFRSGGGPVPFIQQQVFTISHDITNFHGLKNESTPDNSMSKAMTYPYFYYTINTAIGNNIDLIPQTNMQRNNVFSNTLEYHVTFRFMGGEVAKLQMRIAPALQRELSPLDSSSSVEWVTIMEYPTIPWATAISSLQQLGELSTRMSRKGLIQKSIIGSAVSGTGFMHGIRGGKPDVATQGLFRAAMTTLGNAISGTYLNPFGINNQLIPRYQLQNDVNQQTALNNANNIVTSGNDTIVGDSAIDSIFKPPIAVYACGYSNSEQYSMCRMFERYGQSINCNINPLNNTGDVLGGRAYISSFNGQTYYKFMTLDVDGTLPVNFKNSIEDLFVRGVYIVN